MQCRNAMTIQSGSFCWCTVIHSNQYWAALVIASNYILVITLYPAILMLHHRFIKKYEDPLMKWTCCICCTLWSQNKKAESPEPAPDAGDKPATLVRQRSEMEIAEEYRWIEQFLGRKWAKWIEKSKIYNLVFFLLLVIAGFALAAQLSPEEDTSRFMKDDHYLSTLLNMLSHCILRV